MKGLWLARHGALPPNPERRFIGAADIPLSDTGRAQTNALASDIAPLLRSGDVAAFVCSDLRRSRESAAILRALTGVEDTFPLLVEPGLREISLGSWEGLSPSGVERAFPGQYAERGRNPASFCPPGGESFQALRLRALAALVRLRGLYPEGILLIVGHAGINRTLIAEYLALPLADLLRIPQPYACATFLAGW
ncbi:MAG: histidine phosphatase family protein [Desulfovibrio sp.]|jgi:probable phosphoglycerate mutase|nr:histidine phosphatase family protein [Desulfovibrio sp.]